MDQSSDRVQVFQLCERDCTYIRELIFNRQKCMRTVESKTRRKKKKLKGDKNFEKKARDRFQGSIGHFQNLDFKKISRSLYALICKNGSSAHRINKTTLAVEIENIVSILYGKGVDGAINICDLVMFARSPFFCEYHKQ